MGPWRPLALGDEPEMLPDGLTSGLDDGVDTVTSLPEANAITGTIRTARKARGWTQTQLGNRAGVSRPTVARLEGGSSVSSTTLIRIAAALDLRLRLDD